MKASAPAGTELSQGADVSYSDPSTKADHYQERNTARGPVGHAAGSIKGYLRSSVSERPQEYPELGESLLKKGKTKARFDHANWQWPQQPGALGASSSSGTQQPAAASETVSHLRRGPPKFPRFPDMIMERHPGETEQDYKCRVARERYLMVVGNDPQEADTIDFFKQAIAAYSRGVISLFITGVMIARHWGNNHIDTDTSIATIAKTMREMTSWVHPDHLPEFVRRSKDHHDLLHNGFLVITMAVANLKSTLLSVGTVGVYLPRCNSRKNRRSTSFVPARPPTPLFGTQCKRQASHSTPVLVQPARVLPETPLIETRSKSG